MVPASSPRPDAPPVPCRPPETSWVLGSGIATVVLGVSALLGVVLLPDAITPVLGLALLGSGLVQGGTAIANKAWQGFDVHLLDGMLLTAAGALLSAMPGLGLDPVMVVSGAVLVATGILEGGFGLRRCAGPGRGWLILAGAGQIAAGAALWLGLPAPAPWGLGTALAAGLCVIGLGRIGLAGGAPQAQAREHRAEPRVAERPHRPRGLHTRHDQAA